MADPSARPVLPERQREMDFLLGMAARIARHPELYWHEPIPVRRAAWRVMCTLYAPPEPVAGWRRELRRQLRGLSRALRAAERSWAEWSR